MKQRVKKKIIIEASRRKMKTQWSIKSALRMKPSHFLNGEIANPEALDILKMMNAGHIGSISH